MAEQELQMEESGKGKMIIIIIVAILLLGGGAAAYFLMGSSDQSAGLEQGQQDMAQDADGEGKSSNAPNKGTALYVAMPRPFVFNVPGQGKDRLAQIKVQLMVRGTDNEEQAKMHIPLIEGTLLRVFSSVNADDLVTEAGKIALRDQSVREVQKVLKENVGSEVVEQVLFTGFVMQ